MLSWLYTTDRRARTRPGLEAFLARFKTPEERSAYFRALAARSPVSTKKKTDTAPELAVSVREAANADRVSAA
jgi:hypothetical protein